MCSDASVFDNFYGVSESNRKIAKRDAIRVIEAYACALVGIHFVFKRDVDIVLTEYSRVKIGNSVARDYSFKVFEKGTNEFITNYVVRL